MMMREARAQRILIVHSSLTVLAFKKFLGWLSDECFIAQLRELQWYLLYECLTLSKHQNTLILSSLESKKMVSDSTMGGLYHTELTHPSVFLLINSHQAIAQTIPDPELQRNASVIHSWHDPPRNDNEEQPLGEDVYSLIFVAPVRGRTFLFALFVICLKMALMLLLATDLYFKGQGLFTNEKTLIIRATQFLLIPVAIAMQEDLCTVFTRIANLRYNENVLEVSPYATPTKFSLSFLLRFMDGLLSLIVNFVLILITEVCADK